VPAETDDLKGISEWSVVETFAEDRASVCAQNVVPCTDFLARATRAATDEHRWTRIKEGITGTSQP